MKKRILILALVATLVISMLSGCGKTTNDVTPSPTPSPVVDANALGDVEKEDTPTESSNPVSDPTAKPTNTPTKEPAQQTSKPQESTAPTSTPTSTPVATPTPTPAPAVTISVTDLMSKMVASLPQETCALSEMPTEYYADVYGVNPADFEQVLVYGSMMNVKSNEIILIKAKDASGAAKAKEILNQRLAALDEQWKRYLPDQYELVKAGTVNANGLYLALVVADGAKSAVSTFNSLTK